MVGESGWKPLGLKYKVNLWLHASSALYLSRVAAKESSGC